MNNVNELQFDVKFCEIKADDFQVTLLILLAQRWSRGYWKVFNLLGPKKPFWPIKLELSEPLFTVHQRFVVRSWAIYLR